MTYLDLAILNFTERACRRFQMLTGRTNVWLAVQLTNLSIIMYFVCAAIYFWRSAIVARILVGLFCAGLMYVLTQTVFRVPIETYENDAYRRVSKGLRNPRRLRDAPLRISFLTLLILLCFALVFLYLYVRLTKDRTFLGFDVMFFALLSYSLIVLTTMVLYLLACDPLPPSRSKVREWLRGLTPARVATAPE